MIRGTLFYYVMSQEYIYLFFAASSFFGCVAIFLLLQWK